MSLIEIIWYFIVFVGCLVALFNWRKAIYIGIVIDVLRDPVRKLLPEQPVVITLSGVLVWGLIVFVVLFSRRDALRMLYRKYPMLRTAMVLLLFALLPAAGISAISYTRGWLVAAIGAASYLLPCLGILTGFAMLRKERDAARFMLWYAVVNSIMLISVPMEYFKFPVPALGGIEHEWMRYRSGYTVDLMCGWYRSPDIMGLHAAHVIMFSLLLAVRKGKGQGKVLWLLPVLWAAFCVLLSGRRKMIGIPLVFVAVYMVLGMIYRISKVGRLTGLAAVVTVLGSALIVFAWSPDQSVEYVDFASSVFTEGLARSNDGILESTIGTLKQTGIIGGGLGMATQGRYYAGLQSERHLRGWQEDGVSRLFLEFGVFGVILLICCLMLLHGALKRSMRGIPPRGNEILMQLGLVGVIAGDAASYAVSHQQFSGDPVSALFVTLMIGMVLKMPWTLVADNRPSVGPVGDIANGGAMPLPQRTLSMPAGNVSEKGDGQ